MPTARVPQTIIAILERAVKAADMEQANCACTEEAKKEFKLYLDTWVNGPAKAALAWAKGEKTSAEVETWAK